MLVALTILLLQIAPATAPATLPTSQPTLESLRSDERERLRQSMQSLSPLSPRNTSEVISLSIDKELGLLTADSPIASTEGAHRVELLDLPGLAQVNVGLNDKTGDRWIDFQQILFNVPDGISALLQLFARDDYLMLAYDFTGTKEELRVQLIQSPRMADNPEEVVRLYVERFDSTGDELIGRVNIKSPSFVSLLKDHSDDALRYVLRPIFDRNLHRTLLVTSSGDAWQVLGDSVPPPAEMKEKVAALIVELNDDQFAKREAASESLKSLGAAGAMALRQVDTKPLTEEQRQSIEAILASYSRMPADQIAEKQKDRLFLIGVLYSKEMALWPSAAARVGSLNNPTNATEAQKAGDSALLADIQAAEARTPASQPSYSR